MRILIVISANCNIKGINNSPKGFVPKHYNHAKELWNIISVHTYSPIIYKHDYRMGDNFLYSDLCVLDVDNDKGIYTLEDCKRDFGDCTILVGSTRSHMIDKHGVIAPRFRILIPWETRIRCPYTYKASIEYAQGLCEGADKSTKDLARMFYPCKELLFASGPGEKMPVVNLKPEAIKAQIQHDNTKSVASANAPIPQHIKDFLKLGKVFGGSRNTSIYTTARTLLEKGLTLTEIEAEIAKAPFDRRGFFYHEIKTALKSAEKKERRVFETQPPLASQAQQDN